MLSGRSTVVTAEGHAIAEDIVGRCCRRLQIQGRGTKALVHGTEVLPARARVRRWSGIRPRGQVTEYQLVL
eukprot:6119613-Amphidinium_carterae.1